MTPINAGLVGNTRRIPRFIKPALLVALLVVIAGTFTIVRRSNGKPAEKIEPPVTLEFAAADLAIVEQKGLARAIPFSGSLQPVVQSTVKSKVSGTVQRMLVREGQQVSQGQVIAEIETADIKARLDTQVALLEEAKARWQIATKNRDNNLALLKQNFISQNAFDTTQSTYEATVATVKSNEAQVKLAKNAMQDAVIRSPIGGIVAKRMVNVGEKVGPDSPLFSVVDLSKMEIEAPAPATEIPSVKVGQSARFQVDGFGDRSFEGRVERINPVTEQGSRSITLYLSVANTDGALKGGMFAKGSLVLERSASAPVIPASAVREDAGQTYVFTLEKGKIERRPVQLGLRDEQSGFVELKSGVAPGTQVISARMAGLKPGTAAVVKGSPAAAPKS